ncbi:FAS1 domain-containing protein [Sordaria brevicollis]|uniref:FAS1 domain-containing protein n=1 Tax=Sordaria brevicollis TaxID=83679 RepID=A0AAE0NVT8_SORBR|nr:FAS1 domain-containing protein [Sordaria brevicollis]
MIPRHILFALSAASVVSADTLINTLQQNGFNDFASIYQNEDPSLLSTIDAGSDMIIYATKNIPANSTLGRRDNIDLKRRFAISSVQKSAPSTKKFRFKRQNENSSPAVYESLLSDPEVVNLGEGVSQSVVEKPVDGVPNVIAGAGKAVPVVGDDIAFDNGVIRPVDSLLEIPGSIGAALTAFPQLSTLASLLTQFNLVEPVSQAAGITVLAPENSAFENVDTSGLSDEEIVAILSQHVIVNYVGYSPRLEDGQVLNTLANGTVTVAIRDGNVYFNGAQVTAADVIVENGVVHTVASVVGFEDAGVPEEGGEDNGNEGGDDTETPPATGAAGRVGLGLKTLGLAALGVAAAALF